MRARAMQISFVAVVVLALAAAPAAAALPDLPSLPMGIFGIDFPSVKSIVSDVVRFFFSTFLDALVPDWLKHASVTVIRRLVTVPNPTDPRAWPTLARLSDGMRWIALPLLSLAAVASWVQQWLREMTGRPGSLAAVLPRTVLAALLLVVYPTLVANAVALVNSITNAMLSLPVVEQGLQRTVGIVFAGTLLSGDGLLLTLLGIAAVLLAVGLFMLSIGLLVVFAVAFVSAPIAIACSVLDETRGIWTAWRYTLLSAGLVPIGWCVLFSTAGAFVLDMTSWSGGIAGTLGARVVGVFAALIIFWLAIRWPLMLWGAIRTHLSGALLSVGRAGSYSGSGNSAGGGRIARVALQRASLRAGDAMGGALGTTRTRATSAARTALADNGRLLARVPGAGAAVAVGAGVAAAAGARLAPAAAVAPAGRAVRRAAGQLRARGGAAAAASKTALAAGASSRETAGAALRAITNGERAKSHGPSDPASRRTAARTPAAVPSVRTAVSTTGRTRRPQPPAASARSPKQRMSEQDAGRRDAGRLVLSAPRRPNAPGALTPTSPPAVRPLGFPAGAERSTGGSSPSARPAAAPRAPRPGAPAPPAPVESGRRRTAGRPGPKGR